MKKKILKIILGVLIVFIIGFGVYVNDYYHATSTAKQVLDHDGVTQVNKDLISLTPQQKNDTGIIFYPGAKVESEAYLPLLEKLKNQGYSCYLIEMPFHMAIFNSDAALSVMKQYPDIKHWYICGHSMGGAMASKFVSEHQEEVDGLILLGAYIYGDVSSQDTLTIYGSLNTSVEEKIDYKENIVVIEGGNHAQFGNYGKQAGDKEATITSKQQQDQAVKAIVSFIESR